MQLLPVYQLPFTTVFLMFIIFSFAGWCSEVIYVGIISEHKFVNRGFLYGPLCPIYGMGGLVILLLPPILYSTWIPLFIASAVLCSAVEYFGSWLLEKMFHTLWWDYSHYKINLNGRICLLNSVLFGIMGTVAIHFVIPFVMLFINWMGPVVCKILTAALGSIFIADGICTIRRLVDFNTTMAKLQSFGENIKDTYGAESWFRGENLSDMLESIKERAEIEKEKFSQSFLDKVESLQQCHANVEGLIKRFPTLKSRKYQAEIKHFKQYLLKRIKK